MPRPLAVLGDLASAVGVVLLFPLAIILIGLPVVLVVRLVMAVAAW
jgi:hypothetical protein